MGRLQTSSCGEYFLMDGKKHFILCDTMWTAMYNITIPEWKAYLDYRRMQGYNSYQFNMIQQWDGGEPNLGIYAFERNADGSFDFSKMSDEYFAHAREKAQIALEKGFIPVVFVLHASYVAGSWLDTAQNKHIMPIECVEPYTKKVAETFLGLNPVYVAAGDTNLKSEVTRDYFWRVLKTLKKIDPEALCAFHLQPDVDLMEEFSESELLDFYALQPGHRIQDSHYSYSLTLQYYNEKKKRPIINDEFFYEGHGFGHENYGRYSVFEQRKSIWQSILAGAKAGIAYGAHGLWGWYDTSKDFANSAFAGPAFTWQTALRFPGAWEGSFSKYIVEQYDLFELVPYDGVLNEYEQQRNEIRAAKTRDNNTVVLYIPYSVPVKLGIDISGYDLTLIDLEHKYFGKPVVKSTGAGCEIAMYDFNSDALLIAVKK